MKRALFLLLVLLCAAPAAHATPVEVTGRNGVKAWLVEDHKLPLIAVHFAFRGGVEQDPADKEGLATLAMKLLEEGAGPYNAAAFQQKLSDHSIELGFGAGRDELDGSIKALSENRQEAFDLLTLALTQPRIEAKDFERERNAQLTALRSQFANPEWQARYALFQKIFGHHPYGQRRLGSVQSLASITRENVRGFIADHLAQDNLVIAVAGDITPAELEKLINKSFGKLPRHAHLSPVDDFVWPADPAVITVPRDGTQTAILFALPGPKQDDPDWFAARIADYIVGGGGFSARLMQEVRDKRGLTYGIDLGLSPAEHGGVILGEAATDNPKTKEAWDVTLATMRDFYANGATEKEIAAAKDYLTGSLPLAMTSTDGIAQMLVHLQLDHRPIDFLDQESALIRKVSADDVSDAIRRWFNPDRISVSMVGKPDGIVPTETRALVRE